MSGIKFKVGNDDPAAARAAGSSVSRSEENKRAGEVGKTPETNYTADLGKQSFDREAGKISVSELAAQVGKLVDKVKDAPEIRQERVEALRRQIETGEYNPPATEIADAILKNET